MNAGVQITVVLADDHPLIRGGLKEAIGAEEDISVVAEAPDGKNALELIKALKPAVAVLDVDMPGMSGLDVAKELQGSECGTSVIILTMYNKQPIFDRAMDLGVLGYVLKDSATVEVVDAIRKVHGGEYYISPAVSGLLMKRSASDIAGPHHAGLSTLTPSERRVLKLIADSMTSKEIADKLSLSVRTVDTHRTNICTKLDIHGTNALLRFALEKKYML